MALFLHDAIIKNLQEYFDDTTKMTKVIESYYGAQKKKEINKILKDDSISTKIYNRVKGLLKGIGTTPVPIADNSFLEYKISKSDDRFPQYKEGVHHNNDKFGGYEYFQNDTWAIIISYMEWPQLLAPTCKLFNYMVQKAKDDRVYDIFHNYSIVQTDDDDEIEYHSLPFITNEDLSNITGQHESLVKLWNDINHKRVLVYITDTNGYIKQERTTIMYTSVSERPFQGKDVILCSHDTPINEFKIQNDDTSIVVNQRVCTSGVCIIYDSLYDTGKPVSVYNRLSNPTYFSRSVLHGKCTEWYNKPHEPNTLKMKTNYYNGRVYTRVKHMNNRIMTYICDDLDNKGIPKIYSVPATNKLGITYKFISHRTIYEKKDKYCDTPSGARKVFTQLVVCDTETTGDEPKCVHHGPAYSYTEKNELVRKDMYVNDKRNGWSVTYDIKTGKPQKGEYIYTLPEYDQFASKGIYNNIPSYSYDTFGIPKNIEDIAVGTRIYNDPKYGTMTDNIPKGQHFYRSHQAMSPKRMYVDNPKKYFQSTLNGGVVDTMCTIPIDIDIKTHQVYTMRALGKLFFGEDREYDSYCSFNQRFTDTQSASYPQHSIPRDHLIGLIAEYMDVYETPFHSVSKKLEKGARIFRNCNADIEYKWREKTIPNGIKNHPIMTSDDSGKKCYVASYHTRNGVLHGDFRTYYDHRVSRCDPGHHAIQYSGTFYNGKLRGQLKYYETTDRMADVDSVYYKRLDKNGTLKNYTHGILKTQLYYKDDELSGKIQFHDPYNDEYTIAHMKNGKLQGRMTKYRMRTLSPKHDRPITICHFVDGVKHGEEVSYYPDDGTLKEFKDYKEGVLHGSHCIYKKHPDNVDKLSSGEPSPNYCSDNMTYVRGVLYGPMYKCFLGKRGVSTMKSFLYVRGERHGDYKRWEDGKIVNIGHYVKGKLDGEFVEYFYDGDGVEKQIISQFKQDKRTHKRTYKHRDEQHTMRQALFKKPRLCYDEKEKKEKETEEKKEKGTSCYNYTISNPLTKNYKKMRSDDYYK